jgi:hypothetical protein
LWRGAEFDSWGWSRPLGQFLNRFSGLKENFESKGKFCAQPTMGLV